MIFNFRALCRGIAFQLSALFLVSTIALAQAPGCPNINAGPDRNLTCATNCTTLAATVLQTGSTTSYAVSSVAYAPPVAYSGGTALLIGTDDIWGNVITLPFNFCFYGNMYDKVVVGANGLISFDLSVATTFCAWSYTASIPSSALYTNSIMGAYHDIDPSVSGNINYYITGTAPCRMFVVNFNNIPHYDCDCTIPFFGSCKKTTQQIVIYETTNVIEVYLQKKELCSSWNGGRATIGIQDATGANGVTPPGRNTGQWSATNEAWRFTPNGTPNYTVKWYSPPGTQVGTGLTLNVCPTGTTTYRGEATYQHCDGTTVVVTDDVTLNVAGGFTTNLTTTAETCIGCNGSATVLANGGTPPFTYNIGNGNIPAGVFPNLCAGNYTITVADNAGCSGTVTPVIASGQNAISIATVLTHNSCAGTATGTAAATPTGGASPYTYNWSNGQATATATALAAGTYTLTVTDANTCTATKSVTITAPVGMTVTIASSTNVSCAGGNNGAATAAATGGSTPYNFAWSDAQITATATGLIAGQYIVAVIDANTCTATNTVTITEPAGMSASITNTTHVSCSGGNNGASTVTVTNGVLPYIYVWSNAQATATATGLMAGAYTVTVTDASTCNITAGVTITEPAPLTSSATSTNVLCNGGVNGTVTVTANGGVLPYLYGWSNSATSATANGLVAGNYTVTVTDNSSCTTTSSATVTEPAAPTFSNTVSNVSCFGGTDGSITFSNAANGSVPYQYSINGGGTYQAAAPFGALAAGAYDLIIKDANNCVSQIVPASITEPAGMSLTATSVNADCILSNGSADVVAAGGAGNYVYVWSNVPPSNSATANAIPAGNYTVTVTDNNGCTQSVSVSVGVNDNLSASISSVTNASCNLFCDGSATVTTAGAVGNVTYLWDDALAQSMPMALALCAGNYIVTATDAAGCVRTTGTSISEPLPVTVSALADAQICIGQSATIRASATGVSPFTFGWMASPADPGMTDPTLQNQTVFPIVSTTYTVGAIDADGCVSMTPATVTITVLPPLALAISTIGPSSICPGETANLTFSGSGGDGNYTYTWSGGSGNVAPPLAVSPAATTNYSVTVTDGCGSPQAENNMDIVIYLLAVIDFVADQTNGCVPFRPVFTNNTNPSSASYSWNFGDPTSGASNVSTQVNPGHTYYENGTYSVRLAVVTPDGCKDTITKIDYITAYPLPVARFSATPEITKIMYAWVQMQDQSIGANSWQWEFGDGFASDVQNPLHLYEDTGTFIVKLRVESQYGCLDSTTRAVIIEGEFMLYVPNAFTPDGDGVNDTFSAKGEGIENGTYMMRVFNRWGEQIFASRDLENQWDGTHGGEPAKEDVYSWIIKVVDLEGSNHVFKGHVSLIR